MKNSKFTFVLVLLILGLINLSNVKAATIHSTVTGGSWNNTLTWVGGVIPDAGDDVVLNGPVYAVTGNSCNDINITASGQLRNLNNTNHTLIVYGDIENHGTISNNNYLFYLEIYGDIRNWGIFNNYKTTLKGGSTTYLYQYDYSVFGFTYFYATEPDSVFAETTLRFHSTHLEFNNNILKMYSADSLKITGNSSYLNQANVLGNNSTLYMNGGYLSNCNIDEVTTAGSISVKSNVVFTTSLINNGTLSNYLDNNYSCSVLGDIYNYGSITHSNYTLYIDIAGNITNAGTWNNNRVNITGNGIQQLSCDPASSFNNITINVNKTGSYIDALTGLNFVSCVINVNNDTIYIAGGEVINMQGGYINEAVIIPVTTKAAFEMNMSAGATIYASDIHNVTLQGTTFCGNTTFTGDIYNNSTLTNHSSNHYMINIVGNLYNTGSISNYNHNLTMQITGDILNDGTWNNNILYLTGSGDQHISCLNANTFSCTYFTNQNLTGNLYADHDLYFSNCHINFQDAILQTPLTCLIEMNAGYLYQMHLTGGTLHLHSSGSNYFQDVTIDNPVSLTGTTNFASGVNFNGTVINNGTMQNYSTGNYTTHFNSDLTNNGTITNYNYNFILHISGNVVNNGTWTNNSVYLNGSSSQEISCLNSNVFNCALLSVSGTGPVISLTDLYFSNCNIDFQNKELQMPAGTLLSISGSGRYLNQVNITGGNFELLCSNGYYIQNTVINNNTELSGTTYFAAGVVFNGEVVNSGTLKNYPTGNYTINFNSDLTNNGNIQNYNYNLYLHISGNVVNNGMWTNHSVYLNGSTSQEISCPNSNVFSCDFMSVSGTGPIISLSNLYFSNCNIEFQNKELQMPAGTILSLNGSGRYLNQINITGGDFELSSSSGNYIQNAVINNNTELSGTTYFAAGVVFNGEVVNSGTLQCYPNNHYTTYFNNDLTNNGTIQNHNYNLYLYILGNVVNNGTWINAWTSLIGNTDQSVTLIGGTPVNSQFRFDATTGKATYQWYKDGGLMSGQTGSELLLNPVTSSEYGLYNCLIDGTTWSRNFIVQDTVQAGITVNLKVYLEGPFDVTDMDADLNTILPLTQPYNGAPWNYAGTESVVSIPNTNIVDWVLVELRETTGDASTATSDSIIAQQAAFLLNDGSIVGMDGNGTCPIATSISNNLFVVIWHRNHLGIMSANPLSETGGVYTYNFTTGSGQAYGGANGHKEIGTGIWGMIGGDGDANSQIGNADKNDVWAVQAGTSGYLSGDFTMDVQVNNSDKNDVWAPNSGKGGQVPDNIPQGGFKCMVPK